MRGRDRARQPRYALAERFIPSPHLYVVIALVAFLYLLTAHRHNLTDTVFFGGDSWDYQALGVNLAMGHGYQEGGIEPFPVYRFDPDRQRNSYDAMHYPQEGVPGTYYEYFLRGGRYFFFRTPGYPLFLGLVYAIFGVRPVIVKTLQMILLAVSVGLIPWIGGQYWGRLGIFSGIAASLLFLRFCPDPTEIMAESLMVFALFLWAFLLTLWEKKRDILTISILGVVTAGLVLVKGTAIYVPMFFVLFLILNYKGVRSRRTLVAVYCLALACVIIPWSYYATAKTARLVLLSTDQGLNLMDSNNEDSIDDGGWHPEWRKDRAGDTRYLYNQPAIRKYPPVVMVGIFFNEHRMRIPMLLARKVVAAFLTRGKGIPAMMTLMLTFYVIALFRKGLMGNVPLFPLIYFLNLLVVTLVFYGNVRFVQPFMLFFLLPAVHLTFYAFSRGWGNASRTY